MLVDTGAEKLVLLASHVPWIAPSNHARAFTNLGGSFALQEIRLANLQLGDTFLDREPVYLSEREMPFTPSTGSFQRFNSSRWRSISSAASSRGW